MIELYTVDETDYTKHGRAILHPISCTVSEKAGGNYDLSMQCQIDDAGIWRYLNPFAIIKVPVPVAPLAGANIGGDVTVWKVTWSPTPVYAKPNAPTRVTYDAWESGQSYPVGKKITYQNQNYQLETALTGYEIYQTPNTLNKWKTIANETKGAAVLVRLPQNTEVYLLQDYSSSWIYIQTKTGIKGYVLKSMAVFVRDEHIEPVPPRKVYDQLFRITQTVIASDKHTVTVTAQHVSYDLSGNMLGECDMGLMEPGVAISTIQSALMLDADFVIATDLDDTDGLYTANMSYKNGTFALLDPDTGIVGHYNAMLVRDNWDFFIYRRAENFRGMTLNRGKNLIGVQWKTDISKIITRIIPVAKASDGKDLYLTDTADAPGNWIDSPFVDAYPVIYMERLSVAGQVGKDDGEGGTYTVETLRAKMREAVAKRYDKDKCDVPTVELTVNFIMLGDTAEYAGYKGLQELYMYDTVRVHDDSIGLDLSLSVNETTWDAVNQRYTGIKLATLQAPNLATIAGYDVHNGTIDISKLSIAARQALGV